MPAAGTPPAAPEIDVVRHFNRTVTERIGALDEDYLARHRPLGASRVLWEIDEAGTETLALRRRLGLDSGYLSRVLRRARAQRPPPPAPPPPGPPGGGGPHA